MKITRIIDFLKLSFPLQQWTILKGIFSGTMSVAIIWYPLPILLKGFDIPKQVLYLLLVFLLFYGIRLIMIGELINRDLGVVGWSIITVLVLGIIMLVLAISEGTYVLISGIGALIIFFVIVAKVSKSIQD